MKKHQAKRDPVSPRWVWGVLLGAVYLGVWFYLDPSLRYHVSAPVFFSGRDFLAQHAGRPGGLLHYASAFLAQLDYRAWLGAAVFTAVVGLVVLGTRLCLWRCGVRPEWALVLPGFLLVLIHGQYVPPALEIAGGVLLALVGWYAWLLAPKRPFWVRLVLGWILGALLFQVAGLLPCLLYLVVAGMHEALNRRYVLACLGCWLPILGWLLVLANRPGIEPWALLDPRDGRVSWIAAILLCLYYPVILGAAALWTGVLARGTGRAPCHAPGRSTPAGKPLPLPGRFGQWAVRLGIGLVAATLFGLTFDPRLRTLTRIQQRAEVEDWQGVLRAATGLRAFPPAARLQVIRALFHTGRLTSDLFAFAQEDGADLLPSLQAGLEVCLPVSDTLLELGQVNLAEHYAHEALEIRGDRPEPLWRLARINLVKNRPRAARVFLNALGRIPFHRARAEYWLRALDRDPELAQEEEISRLRSLQVEVDVTDRRFPAEALLRDLLRSHSQNRMAAEYLLAHFLLTRRPDQVALNLDLLGPAGGGTGFPRHIEEALLLQRARQGAPPVDLRGRLIARETATRFEQFAEALSRGRDRAEEAGPALASGFGDTYWFYEVFGRTFGPQGPASGWRVP